MKVANIYFYQVSLLYLQYVIMQDIDVCGDLVETCKPDDFDQMTHNDRVEYWMKLQDLIDQNDVYRICEIIAFYSQLLAIVVYTVYAKLFLGTKKRLGQMHRCDPF